MPSSTTNVTITTLGTYTVTINDASSARYVLLNNANATLLDAGSELSISTTLSVEAGTLSLGTYSILYGGTISVSSSGILESAGGGFVDITCEGPITLAAESSLTLNGTTTFVGSGGSGAGTLSISGGSELTISGSIAGTSTINLVGDIAIDNSLTLSSGTLNAGTEGGGLVDITCLNLSGSAVTLTIGSGYTINDVGDTNVDLSLTSLGNPDAFINQGTIVAEASSGTFNLGLALGGSGPVMLNEGSVLVSNGDTLEIDGASFSNSGLISVAGAGSALILGGAISNTGTIETAGGLVALDGTLTTAALDGFTNNGGTIGLDEGYLNNSGATLSVGQGTALGVFSLGANDNISIGTIFGGVVAETDSSFLVQQGTLWSVNFWGTIDLAGSYQTLTLTGTTSFAGVGGVGSDTINMTGLDSTIIFSGPALTGVSTVLETGDYSAIVFDTSQTFNEVAIDAGGNDGSFDSLDFSNGPTSGVTVTFGSQLVVNQVGIDSVSFAFGGNATVTDELINQGSILAGVSGGQLHLGGTDATGFIINSGIVSVSNNDAIYVAVESFTNSGTVAASSGGSLDLTHVGTFTNLSSGTLSAGCLSVGQASTLELANNLVITVDSSSITLSSFDSVIQSLNMDTGSQVSIDATLQDIASGGTLALLNDRDFTATANGGTFTNAGTLVLGGGVFVATQTVMNSALVSGTGTFGVESTSGSVITFPDSVVFDGQNSIVGGTISLVAIASGSGTISVASGAGVIFDGGGAFNGSILDAGSVGIVGTQLTATQLTISAGGLLTGEGTWGGAVTDNGLIDANSGTLAVAGLTGSTSGTWAGGGLEADAGALLQLATGSSISADAGIITLSGSGSEIAWLSSPTGSLVSLDSALSSVLAGGTLSLLNGRSFSASAAGQTFSCAGVLVLDQATFTAKQLKFLNGATVDGTGTLTTKASVAGTVSANGGELSLGGSLSGAGTLVIGATETVSFSSTSGGAFSGLLNDGGSVLLSGSTLTSASITVESGATLSGFGTLGGALTNMGLVEATGGTLSVGLAGSNGTLAAGGQIEVAAAGILQIAANQSISAIADSVTLSDTGLIQSLNTSNQSEVSLASSLDDILSTGTLSLIDGQSFSATGNGGTFTDAGLLSINASTFTATTLTVSSSGTFVDDGTFNGALQDIGSVEVSTGDTLALTGSSLLGGSFSGGGIIDLAGGGTYTVASSTTLAVDTVQLEVGVTLSGAGTIVSALEGAGTVTAQGGTLVLEGSLRGSYGLVASGGSVLDLADGSSYFGSITGSGNLINADQVSGASYAVSLTSSSTLSVSNISGGDLYAGTGTGVILAGSANVVTNAGSMFGSLTGLSATGTIDSISNSGFIIGDTGPAIYVSAPTGTTTIMNSGTIANYEGSGVAVELKSLSTTFTNSGTIIGGYYLSNGGTAIQFGNGKDRLILDPGSSISGIADGGNGNNTLELAVDTGTTGTLAGLGINYTNFGAVQVDSGASWTLTGTNSLASNVTLNLASGASTTLAGTLTDVGGKISNVASLTVSSSGTLSGTGNITGAILDQGVISAAGGTLTIAGALSGSGLAEIAAGSTLIEDAGVSAATLSFLSGTGTLDLTTPANFASIIAGFDTTDTIDLLNSVVTGDTFVNNTLTLTGASGTIGTFLFTGNYTGDSFSFGTDGHSGTIIHLV